MVDVINSEDKGFVVDIANSMLEVCDGASSEDGQGFNKFDSSRVRAMDFSGDVSSLGNVLLKYKGQITGMGYDYKRLLKIVKGDENWQKPKNSVRGKAVKIASVEIDGDYVVIKTPYNANLIDYVKSLKGRYNPEDKSWTVSIGYVKEVTEEVILSFSNNNKVTLNVPNLNTVKAGEIICNGIKSDVLVAMKYNSMFIEWIKTNDIFRMNRRWDADKKAWRITVANKEVVDEIFKMAELFNIGYSKKAETNLNKFISHFDKRIEMSNASESEFKVDGLGGEMYPFQTAGVKFTEELGGRVLIADEMGLGKTIQALAWIQHHPEVRPVLIIVPASLKENWRRESIKWVTENNRTVVVNSGKTFETGDITIINYDIVSKYKEELLELNPECVILDESHYIKNFKANRTQAVQEVCRGVKHIMALSGTPMLNRPVELWTVCNMIAPNTFNNWHSFTKRYCDAYQDTYGMNVNGASNLEELQEKLRQTMMIRRVKADVLTELPQKRRETVFMDISPKDWKSYGRIEESFVEWLKDNSEDGKDISKSLSAEVLVKIGALRKCVAEIKMKSSVEWINNYMESSSGKLVLFCHHLSTIKSLKKSFPDILVVSGEMNTEDRQKSVDGFQNDSSKRLIVLTFGAGGVGLTLTEAQDVAFLELAWRPADLSQAEDRIHRIGQKGQVTAWYLLAPNTIDESMMDLINQKMKVGAMALDKDAEVSIQRNLISSFLKD